MALRGTASAPQEEGLLYFEPGPYGIDGSL